MLPSQLPKVQEIIERPENVKNMKYVQPLTDDNVSSLMLLPKPSCKKADSTSSNTHFMFHKLIKRAALGSIGPLKTDYAAIISTQGTRNRRMHRECEE